jgi:hypothetical protein
MKFRTYNNISVNGVKMGLSLKDSVLLRKETDHSVIINAVVLYYLYRTHVKMFFGKTTEQAARTS